MPFELFVALRFLREGRAQTGLILGGVSMGVAVIVFLSALIGGLKASLIEQTLGAQPHITIRTPDEAARPLTDGPGVLHQIDQPAQRLRAIDQWQQMIATLVQMARDLGIVPLAEGIETQAESETCLQLNFELAQGFYHGRPAPARPTAAG